MAWAKAVWLGWAKPPGPMGDGISHCRPTLLLVCWIIGRRFARLAQSGRKRRGLFRPACMDCAGRRVAAQMTGARAHVACGPQFCTRASLPHYGFLPRARFVDVAISVVRAPSCRLFESARFRGAGFSGARAQQLSHWIWMRGAADQQAMPHARVQHAMPTTLAWTASAATRKRPTGPGAARKSQSWCLCSPTMKGKARPGMRHGASASVGPFCEHHDMYGGSPRIVGSVVQYYVM